MNDDRITALEKEIAKLRFEVGVVREAIKLESDNTTNHIGRIWDWVANLAYRVIPEYADTRKQIDGIFALSDPPSKPDSHA